MAIDIPPPSHQETGVTAADLDQQTFDYVIVGGGTAGTTLASRLSEDGKYTVAVLEAGMYRPNDPKIDYPAFMTQPFNDPDYDWCLKTVPQKHALDREVSLPRGKVLGGSSALNFLVYQRGHRRELDDIEALGNPGWDWNSLCPYYTRSITAAPPTHEADVHHAYLSDELKTTSGPLKTSFSKWHTKPQSLWIQALSSIGLGSGNVKSQSGNNLGIWASAGTVCGDTGRRAYAATAFYTPAASRSNLSVLCGANVTRISLSDDAKPRAEGVYFAMKDDLKKELFVKAKREVIISAGALKSPQLLELSGIGSPDVLKKAGVECKVESAGVGANMSEHIFVGAAYELKPGFETLDMMRDPEFAKKQIEKFNSEGADRGLIASFISGFAYFNLSDFLKPEDVKSVLEQIDSVDQTGWTEGMKEIHRMQRARYDDDKTVPAMEQIGAPAFFAFGAPPEDGKQYFSLLSALQHPWSRGHIHIKSNDPHASPDIDPQYFSAKADLFLLAKAMQFADHVSKQGSLADAIVRRYDPSDKYQTLEDLEGYVKQHFSTTYHHLGTTSMMPRAKGGVVDERLRVHGVEGLRIVDAGILPFQISAHIQATVYAIAEKAADMIKEDARSS